MAQPLTGSLICSLAALISLAILDGQRPGLLAESGERIARQVGRDCTTDECANNRQGCASCVDLVIRLPAKAWVTKTHCFTTASYPNDLPRHRLAEVPCGVDVAWSRFDTPIVTATTDAVSVHSVYHNRSSDRPRDVKLTVEWYLLSDDSGQDKKPTRY